MAIINESGKYAGKTHADHLLSFAADMGWLTSSGNRISLSELPNGMQSLTALPSVTVSYPGLEEVRYQAADIDGFTDALQDAWDAYSADCILTFAADSGLLFTEAGDKLSGGDLGKGVESLCALRRVVIDDDGKTFFDIKDRADALRFIKQIRTHLPSIEVIDLVDIAIDCGIVTDLTEDKPTFLSYKRGGNYYSALCSPDFKDDTSEQDRIFKFKLEGQDVSSSIFYVTFDAQQNDIRHETEYANRASVFIDTLMKLVMAKYNVLIVHKAAMETEAEIANPPVYSGYREPVCEYSDDDTPTESTQSQLKVLIRYKDTVKRTSFTANVIDDIFITFDEDNRPHWGFSKITPGHSEPTDEPIKFGDSPEEVIRAAKEIDNVNRVKQLSEQREVKYTIFEELRRNENSNLYKLIKQREEIYRQSANSGKDIIPKVEFSLTPLTIYSNHIVSRTLTYHIVGRNPNVSAVYEYKFDPLSPYASSHKVGEKRLTDTNRLVILLQKGDPAFPGAEYTVGCESESVRLSSVNPIYYPEEVYGDVFYPKNKCVPASATGYAGSFGRDDDKVMFYEGDLEPSALSGRGDKYLRRDMLKMPVGSRYFTDNGEDLVLGSVESGENKYAPKYCAKRECPICGTDYYTQEDTWEKISNKYELATGGHCCPVCAGHVVEKGGKKIAVYELTDNGKSIYCGDDPENPQYIHVCAQCQAEGKDGFVFAYKNDDSRRCSICGGVVCGDHCEDIAGKTVCKLCLDRGSLPSTPFGAKGDNTDSDAIWSKIHVNLPLASRKSLNYSLHGRWLRVFGMKEGLAQKTYIFAADKNSDSLSGKRFVFVRAKSFNKQ